MPTQIVLADTQFSIYYDLALHGRFANESGAHLWVDPGMAGFGFGSIGAAVRGKTSSLLPSVIDRAIKIPDLASTAAMHFLQDIGIHGGTSTGTNFIASLSLATTESPKTASTIKIVTLLADSSHYYESSYLNRTWIEVNFAPHGGLKVFDCWKKVINESYYFGHDPLLIGIKQCSPNLFKTNSFN
jgi:cysteine synthase A